MVLHHKARFVIFVVLLCMATRSAIPQPQALDKYSFDAAHHHPPASLWFLFHRLLWRHWVDLWFLSISADQWSFFGHEGTTCVSEKIDELMTDLSAMD